MAATSFDPFRAQLRFAWRNRWARLRRERAQAGMHAAALLALALLLGVPVWNSRAGWGAAIEASLQQWPTAIWLAAVALMTWRFTATWLARRAAARHDWLAALPVARPLRRRRVRDAVLLQAGAFAAFGAMLLSASGGDARTHAFLAFAIATSLLLAWPLSWWRARSGAGDAAKRLAPLLTGPADRPAEPASRTQAAAASARSRQTWSSVIADHGAGRLWRWQRLACGVALHGRTLAWGALAWLAVPMGGGVGALLVVGGAGISLALLTGAWRRSLAVIPQAQRWLEAQPIASARMLRATWAVPTLVLAVAIAAVAGVLIALGTSSLAAFAALALFAFGALQFAAAAAERRRPARIALTFVVHAALLVGVLQAFPIAALPLWMVQMTLLLRRALR